jgi:hypothetical protein
MSAILAGIDAVRTPGDPISFGVALAVVALVTIGASLAPARIAQ